MIKSTLNNSILKHVTAIEENRIRVSDVELPSMVMNTLRKNSKKKSSYASNKIEGNPLTERQVDKVIDEDEHKHFLRPEQEVRNYFMALSFLEKKLSEKAKVDVQMIMDVQAIVEKGASKEKIGLRGEMPPGMLFAVYDAQTGNADYIPPEYNEVEGLLCELENYINSTDDHPLIIAAIVHYQLVTIHPFEDGNGRTARLISGYVLDYYGYGFNGIGSLEEYFAYDPDEYYNSLQMGLPSLYYDGRENPPNPEIWIEYFLRMVELYSSRVYEVANKTSKDNISENLSLLKEKEKKLLSFILGEHINEFTPTEVGKLLNVTNRTVINWTVNLVNNGFVIPIIVKERIRSYRISEYTKSNSKEITEILGK